MPILRLHSLKNRPGKANVAARAPSILDRLEIDAASWQVTLQRLMGAKKFIGNYFGSAFRLEATATQRGTKFVKNLTGRDTPLTVPQAQ